MKDNPIADSPFFRAFPSDRIPEATKDVNVRLFINNSNYCKLYQRIAVKYTREFREIFEATTYSACYIFLRFRSGKKKPNSTSCGRFS